MSFKPLISIIVPAYNADKYISRCLDSLINQTLREIEIIVVDDCSKDLTWEIIDNYSKNDNRIIAIRSPVNKRQGGARNLGIKAAQGRYIGFADSDDWLDPEMYQLMFMAGEEKNCDIVLCDSYSVNDTNGRKKIRWGYSNRYIENVDLLKGVLDGSGIRSLVVWDKIFRRELFINNMILFPENVRYEDSATVPLLYHRCTRMKVLDRPLYNYLAREGSTTGNYGVENIYDQFMVPLYIKKYLDTEGSIGQYRKEMRIFLTSVTRGCLHNILRSAKDKSHRTEMISAYLACLGKQEISLMLASGITTNEMRCLSMLENELRFAPMGRIDLAFHYLKNALRTMLNSEAAFKAEDRGE